MTPIDRLRVLLEEFGSDPAVAVTVWTEDGTDYSIIDVRLESTGIDQAIVIEVTPT